MKVPRTGVALAAILMLAAVPTTLVVAQTQTLARADGRPPDVRARLHDGRMARIKAALRLDEEQLKLWAPVESQLQASFAARQQARTERRERRRQDAGRLPLPDRLDRASRRLAGRAERAKALAETFRPFYASLSDEQKAVAGLVLRPALRDARFGGRRGSMRRRAERR